MGSNNLAPDDADFRTVLLLGSTVDEGDTLAKVEFSVLSVVNALNLN